MGPAAILSILVKANGVKTTEAELTGLNASAKTASAGLAKTEAAAKGAGAAHLKAAKAVAGFVGAYAAVSTLEKSTKTVTELGKTTLTLNKNFGLATKTASEWAAVSTARGTEGKALTMGFKALATQTNNARNALNGGSQAMKDLASKQALAIKQAEADGKSSKDLTKLKQQQALAMEQLTAKSQKGAAVFAQLGISSKDLAKHGDDLNWVLHHVSDGLKDLPGGTNKAAIQAKLFGRTWLNLSPLLRDGSKNLDEQLQLADKYGATLSGKTVKSVQEHIKVVREQKLAMIGLQVAIGTVFLPVLSKVEAAMTKFILGFRQGTGAGGKLHDIIGTIVSALAPFAQSIGTIVSWLSKQTAVANVLVPVLVGLAIAIWAVNTAMSANPFVATAIALAALTIAIVTAYRESATFRNIVDTVFNAIGPIVQTAMSAVSTAVQAAFGAIIRDAPGVLNAITGAFSSIVSAVRTAVSAVSTEIGKWDVLFTVVKVGLAALVAIFGPQFAVIVGIVKTQMALIGIIFSTGWGVVKAIFSGAWIAIKGIMSGAVQMLHGVIEIIGGVFKGDFGQMWQGVKDIFSGGLKAVTSLIKGQVKTLTDAGAAIGNGLKDGISAAFNGILSTVTSFVQKIIDIIWLIPGLGKKPNIGGGGGKTGSGNPISANTQASKGQTNLGGSGHLARGGAFGMTGGTVNKPIVMMGEEAPRFPEYVIPTNPAYRGRAQSLLASAAGKIGMAQGGVFSKGQLESAWTAAGGPAGLANEAAAIALAESGGQANAHNPSGASGPWQILGQLVPGNIFDLAVNAANAVQKWITAPGGGHNFSPWVQFQNGEYKKFLGGGGGGGGLLDAIGGALGGAAGSIGSLIAGGAKALIGKLPGVGSLPDWMQGTGKFVLDKAGDFIKDKISSLGGLLGGGGGGGDNAGSSTTGLVPQVERALAWAKSHGWSGHVISGLRSYASQLALWNGAPGNGLIRGVSVAKPGTSEHERGRAVDVSDIPGFAAAMASAPADSKLLPRGPTDPPHFSVTGHRMGGIIQGLAAGGVTGRPPKLKSRVEQARGLFDKVWGAVGGAMGGGAEPHVAFISSPWVGADMDPKSKTFRTIYWPDFMTNMLSGDVGGQPANGARSAAFMTILHEMAHTRQKTGLSDWESEGGAVNFSRRYAPAAAAALHMPYANPTMKGDPYLPYYQHVLKDRGPNFYGFAEGGKTMPYVGAFKDGGFVNQTGMALVHKGETVVPNAMGGVLGLAAGGIIKMVGGQWVYSDASGQLHQLRVGIGSTGQQYLTSSGKWAPLAASTPVDLPPTKGAGALLSLKGQGPTLAEQNAAAAAGSPSFDDGSGGGGDVDGLNAQIADLGTQIDALNTTIGTLNDIITLQASQTADARRATAVSQSQYAVLAQAISDVASGNIGGRVGLGFMTGQRPGGGVKY